MKDAPQEIRTFFVTSVANLRRPLFKKEEMARLFLNVLQDYRGQGRYLLHEFVVMPDHFHLIVTPAADVPLEKAGQYIKGGFPFRAKRELAFRSLIWQEKSFTNHRISDAEDYQKHREYIHLNPVKAGLAKTPAAYPYSSAFPGMDLDPAPSWIKLSLSAKF
ncbi:MAG TPA: transposase [Candidatus Angelobacter sp.]|jgi:putative transposase